MIDQMVEASSIPQVLLFEVSSSQVSAIIGHKGSTIRSIEKQSGAKVLILQPPSNFGSGGSQPNGRQNRGHQSSPPSLFTRVQLSGTAEQIKQAHQLIDQHLTMNRRYQNRSAQPISHVDQDDDYVEPVTISQTIPKPLDTSPPTTSGKAPR